MIFLNVKLFICIYIFLYQDRTHRQSFLVQGNIRRGRYVALEMSKVMLDLVVDVPGVKFVISCMTGLIKARGQTGYHPGFAFFIVSTSEKEREYFAIAHDNEIDVDLKKICLLYTSPSPRDGLLSRMPSSA